MLLVIYVGSQLLSFYLSTTAVQSKSQRYIFMALPFLFIPFVINFPVGLMIYWVTTNLWTVGQGLVTRRLYPRPRARAAEAHEPNAAPRRRGRRRRGEVEGPEALAADDSGEGTAHRGAAPASGLSGGGRRRAPGRGDERDGRRPPGTGDPDREAEAAGETVGEAKWTALRELERRFPGLDKAQVEFVVLSEGERGLLGVGFVPARVIARVGGELLRHRSLAQPEDEGDAELSEAGTRLKQYLELVRDALEIEASVSIRESAETLVGTFHGRELGLAIGKHGQTIDAIQQLAGAILYRVRRATTGRCRRRSRLPRPAPRRARVPCRPDCVARGRDRAGRRARADEPGGAQDRAPPAQGSRRRRHRERGRRAEPVRGRRPLTEP